MPKWTAGSEADALAAVPTSTSQLQTITRIGLHPQRAFGQDAPDADALVAEDTPSIAIIRDDGTPIIEWSVDGYTLSAGGFGSPIFNLFHVTGVTHYEEAALDAGDVRFGFSTSISPTSVTTDTERRVWARQTERGAQPGILSLGLSTDEDSVIEAAAEVAEFLTRYSPDIAIPSTVTDDLGRVWTVFSASTTDDRRYLRIEGSRAVLQGPPSDQ